ncbi:MAG: PilT/PilU family type 4a pilus ATPase [Patescibacteria group bacterium]|nr:PilT/PilU family type 4a pilus ATPase [Patescibacteria group bacterium]MBU2508981.1 PilT/PilU family type 4a pilus ATPase [Patescibacteria group bacterium]
MTVDSKSLIIKLLSQVAKQEASDLHLQSGAKPVFRIQGKLIAQAKQPTLTAKQVLSEIKKILNPSKFALFEKRTDVDASYELASKERFRLNAYWEKRGPSLAARYIPAKIPSLEDLNAPEATDYFNGLTQGLVLVVGPTGAGKSTLLASMLDVINQTRVEHIVTLEDPIEFVHQNKQCIFSQRELGSDFPTFASGLKNVFRQDPDIILVGEMRDPETISLALTLAETGHLVFATLHTNGAAQTVERIIDSFDAIQQKQIRLQLSLTLKGIISQLLLRSTQDRLVPVHEVLVNNHAVANTIRDGRTEQIQNIIATSRQDGMLDLDQHLHWLVKQEILDSEIAKAHAHNPRSF